MAEISSDEPPVVDLRRQAAALFQHDAGAVGKPMQAGQQLRRRARRFQRLDAGACGLERIERDIDPVERPVILHAILQVIDDLQHRADIVGRGPGRAALAMHVEHEAADRHRRIAAIVDQLVPVRVAVLGDVLAERLEQVLRVLRRQVALGQRRTQRDAGRVVVVAAEQARLQAVEMRELVGLAQASDGRRCRRRSARTRRTPGSAGGAAARPATRPRGNSRPPSPCRIGAALRPGSWAAWYHKRSSGMRPWGNRNPPFRRHGDGRLSRAASFRQPQWIFNSHARRLCHRAPQGKLSAKSRHWGAIEHGRSVVLRQLDRSERAAQGGCPPSPRPRHVHCRYPDAGHAGRGLRPQRHGATPTCAA